MLAKRPDICAHIRKLTVRPNYYLSWPTRDETLRETWVAHMIENISGDLVLLDTFDWDGLEMPQDNLFPPLEDLPAELCVMLIERSPDLEELSISARWQKLHSLTLGSFGYMRDFTLGAADAASFSEFLECHPTLRYIRLQWNFKRWMSPTQVPMHLSPNALPELDTFVGIYQQVSELPNRKTIETLDLTCEPLHEERLGIICPILRTLTSLVSLDLWTHLLYPNQDNTRFFFSILSSCPGLIDLHFMCTMTFTTKPLQQLISQLHLLPALKRFSLTKGHKYGDETMLESALRILRSKPTLQQINIRWAREKAPNHLKQEGTYDITTNDAGEPLYLMVHEQGIPIVGRPFDREYKFSMPQPAVNSATRKAGKLARVLNM
ncbi:hypothetical protein DXG03_008519 [Asterophora parasitica]|uniref:F-box domain-containing protein n=1 Tax=Asterophora parasitica TaxID=117018 RepID=A0A9P7G5U7_9AGAR|nr:hypothetical protein DXG03_008519 [Asterophora parasitica]